MAACRARRERPRRTTALRYAVGVCLCQLGWVGLLFAPHDAQRWLFLVLVVAELAVPVLAERVRQTTWHPHHIAERYGLFTLIVLGETVAAATVAVQSGLAATDRVARLLPIAAGGLLIVFAAWWIYFAIPAHERLSSNREAFPWGYGHYLVFGSAAAIGAGLEVAVEQATGTAHLSTAAASATVTVPTALFMFTVWLLHARHHERGPAQQAVLPLAGLLVLTVTVAGTAAIPLAGVIAAAAVASDALVTSRHPRPAA